MEDWDYTGKLLSLNSHDVDNGAASGWLCSPWADAFPVQCDAVGVSRPNKPSLPLNNTLLLSEWALITSCGLDYIASNHFYQYERSFGRFLYENLQSVLLHRMVSWNSIKRHHAWLQKVVEAASMTESCVQRAYQCIRTVSTFQHFFCVVVW